MGSPSTDTVIRDHRAQIAELDLRILEALNARVRLVKRLREYKASRGLAFRDAAQEERLLAALREANRGPVSDEGLRELWAFLLEWTKREVEGPGETGDE